MFNIILLCTSQNQTKTIKDINEVLKSELITTIQQNVCFLSFV